MTAVRQASLTMFGNNSLTVQYQYGEEATLVGSAAALAKDDE